MEWLQVMHDPSAPNHPWVVRRMSLHTISNDVVVHEIVARANSREDAQFYEQSIYQSLAK